MRLSFVTIRIAHYQSIILQEAILVRGRVNRGIREDRDVLERALIFLLFLRRRRDLFFFHFSRILQFAINHHGGEAQVRADSLIRCGMRLESELIHSDAVLMGTAVPTRLHSLPHASPTLATPRADPSENQYPKSSTDWRNAASLDRDLVCHPRIPELLEPGHGSVFTDNLTGGPDLKVLAGSCRCLTSVPRLPANGRGRTTKDSHYRLLTLTPSRNCFSEEVSS